MDGAAMVEIIIASLICVALFWLVLGCASMTDNERKKYRRDK
jgi:predicted cobalt transporter CbtA